MGRRSLIGVLRLGVACCLCLSACDDEASRAAQRPIQTTYFARVADIVVDDIERHQRGLRYAADRVALGFVRAQPERLEGEMRQVLKLVRSPRKGVRELVISPMSFMAAVGADGRVIARDAEPDRMKGMDLAERFPVVAAALKGEPGYAIGEFESDEKGGESSITILMAAPAHHDGKVVGALVLGIPLWRLSQRLSKQLQLESGTDGVVLWVYVYRGDRLFHHGTPPDLDEMVPDLATRNRGYAQSSGGFTGAVQQYGFTYGFGVRPLRLLGPDVGVIIFHMDPR